MPEQLPVMKRNLDVLHLSRSMNALCLASTRLVLSGSLLGPAVLTAQRATGFDRVELARVVAAVVDSSLAAEHIPGAAVIVVHDGAVVVSRGFGFANLERRVPVNPATTLFRIGSISKVLTSLALVQLAEREGFSLDEPVERFTGGGVIENRFVEPVRLWHLMTHTGAFDQIDAGGLVFSDTLRRSLADFLTVSCAWCGRRGLRHRTTPTASRSPVVSSRSSRVCRIRNT